MAITRTDRGTTQTAAGGAITLSTVSGSFAPAAGSVVVVYAVGEARNLTGFVMSGEPTPSLSDTFGDTGGGSWTRAAHSVKATANNGQYMKIADIWYRVIGTGPTSGAVTVAASYNSGVTTTSDGWWLAFLEELAGADTASLIGGTTGNTGAQAAGPTSLAMDLGSSPASDSYVATCVHSDNSTTPGTVPSGFTGAGSQAPAWGATSQSAFKNGSGTQTFSWTGLQTGAEHVGSSAAFKAVAGGAAFAADPPLIFGQSAPIIRAHNW